MDSNNNDINYTNDFNGNNPYTKIRINDKRMDIISTDSTYCDLTDLSLVTEHFTNYRYCAFHLNIHSLPSKFDQLKYIIQELKENNINVQFILLCETFLVERNADLFQIPGYRFIHKCRNPSLKGVWLYT